MTKNKIINFENFPPIIGQPIIINKNTIFFKSYSIKHGSVITNRPSYFGEINNASKYLKSGRKLGIFSTKKKIKLLDIRYISQIINDLVLVRKNNDFETIIKGYMTLALSYGLISLCKQLSLYKMRYSEKITSDPRYQKIIAYYNDYELKKDKELFQNPLELQGIRIGEINNDVESTIILKEIFGEYFDGFICPSIFSPYFNENYIPNEILLFNPFDSIIELEIIPNNSISVNINKILLKNNIHLFSVPFFMKNNDKISFQYGGGIKSNNVDYIYEKNIVIDKYYNNANNDTNNDTNINANNLIQQGIEFKKYMINHTIKLSNQNDYMFDRNKKLN